MKGPNLTCPECLTVDRARILEVTPGGHAWIRTFSGRGAACSAEGRRTLKCDVILPMRNNPTAPKRSRNAHDTLTADNARLREALERAVQDLDSGWAEDADAHFPWLPDARAALAGGGE